MSFEIERKWFLKELPEMCKTKEPLDIEQCYIASSPCVRIRKSLSHKHQYVMTIKGSGTLKRVEIEHPIPEETYNSLRELLVNKNGIIQKKFWKFKIEGTELYYEISTVDGIWHYIEVEFKSEDEATKFKAPEWFGKEATYDVSIKGYSDLKLKIGKAFDLPKLMVEGW